MTTLGTLLRARRQQANLSQLDLARLLPGLSRGAVNNIENGMTKTLSADTANALVKVLPVSMGEIIRAMGYELPETRAGLPTGMLSDLEAAPQDVLDAVLLLLSGWRAEQQARARRAPR